MNLSLLRRGTLIAAVTTALVLLAAATLIFTPSPALGQSETPATPSSVSLTRADGTLTASWDAVNGATKYHVTYTTDGGGSWHAPVDDHTNVTATSITFNADNGKSYIVGVRAGNGGGQWSGWRNSPASGPYTPPARGIAVEDSSGNAITALSVPEGGEASYYVKLTAQPTEETKVCVYLSVRDKNDPDITFKGEAADIVSIDVVFTLDNWNVAQTVTLVAAEDDDYVNGERDSGLDARKYYSGYVTVPVTEIDNDTPPPAPSAPSSVAVTRADGTVTASWPAVSGATKYHVTYTTDGGGSWHAPVDDHTNVTATSITFNADNSKTYMVGVRAGNDGGWSGWTNSAAAAP